MSTTETAYTGHLDLPAEPRPADYLRIAREIRSTTKSNLEPIRVAFLSSFTFEFIDPFLVVEAARQGLHATTYFGAFGQFEQEIGHAGSMLRRFEPQALVLAMRPEDIEPDAVFRYYATHGKRYAELTGEITARLLGLIRAFREWSQAPVLIANLALPAELPLGLFDANARDTLTYSVAQANAELRERITAEADAIIWDYAGLVRSCGAAAWTDRRLWSLARTPIAPAVQPRLAKHLTRTLCGVRRRPAKCLVLDLDNTIWGGVIGDDGMEGIQLSDDYPGNVYKEFQRSALALMDRGILLTVVSKNDPDVVDQVFREHPEMLIRWEHLAATRINWEPKSKNIREMAAELNLGVDAMVLFDDNPVERAEVRANAPEVAVIEVPQDPLGYQEALWACAHFDQVSLSEEDRGRTEMYRAERERRALAQSFESVDDFLTSLEMVAEVGEVSASTLARVTQLVNKTNQFNLTTRRRSQAEIEALAKDPSHVLAWLRIRDRFGDQGLVAVGFLRVDGETGTIDTFLMSCRMMNRHVEDALLAYLAERAQALGNKRLVGEYFPTKKNAMVKDFYSRHGFEPQEELEGGGQRYAIPMDSHELAWPQVISRPDSGD